MSKTKKFLLMIMFITITIIISVSNKSFAANIDTESLKAGKTLGIGYQQVKDAKNAYCVSHGKELHSQGEDGSKPDYKVSCWVEIKGDKVIASSNGKTCTNSNNATLAAILGGALTEGYGYYEENGSGFNAAQLTVWYFWNTWYDSVGYRWGFAKYSGNSDFSDMPAVKKSDVAMYLAQAKAAAKKTDYHVTIYGLTSLEGTSWQRLIVVDKDSTTTSETPDPGKTEVIGNVNISGYVWEDVANSKNNSIDSKYSEKGDEKKLKGIKVYWKYKDPKTNEVTELGKGKTDENGAYKLTTTITLYNHPYGIDEEKYDQINNSYVEFEYNGLKYTTVAYNGNLSESTSSKGKENVTQRENLDNKFDKVENATVYDGNKAVLTGLPNTKVSDANYTKTFAVSASTQNIAVNLMKNAEKNGWTTTKEFCTKHCTGKDSDGKTVKHIVKKIKTSKGSTITFYCDGKVDIDHANNEVFTTDIINQIKEKIVGDKINNETSKTKYIRADETNGPTDRDCRDGKQCIYEWNIKNVNLGLVRREQPDAAISSDIEKVRVVMKNQEYTYKYGNRGIQNNNELYDYKVKFGDKYMQTYTRAVNPSDIAYVNYNNTDDLKVYVTYNIILKNQSNTLPMKINSIVNYYDNDYTIYTGTGTSTSAGWNESSENNNGFKTAYNSVGITLQPGSQSDIIKLEFEVSQNKIKELQNEDTGFTFTNYSEIYSFTTYYGAKTICSERETAETKDPKKTGKQYAGLDSDSTPGNLVPGKESTYEDDTDRAPSFLLKKDPNYKQMSGTVYEDTQTKESRKQNERLGDGTRDSKNEKGVQNVKVELLSYNNATGQFEPGYLYYKDTSSESGANRKLAVTYTDSEGNYSFGDGVTCGVVVDNYIIKYTYGNADGLQTTIDGGSTIINARNYKSTIITDSNIKSIMTGSKNTNKWHLDMDENTDVSIAIDDMQQRLAQDTLKNSTYDVGENMSAYSKPFEVQVEYTKNQSTYVDVNGGTFAKNWSAFDFGIIERPREDIVINKTISKIKMTLGNGQVLIEGDPRKDKLNYVKALGIEERKEAKFKEIDATKSLSIEMDQELIQGAKLEVWYLITFTNNGENDYEYATNSNYYNYGTDKQGAPLAIADLVVDYMDSTMVCEVGDDFKNANAEGVNNKEWTKYYNGVASDSEYLKSNGYISDSTYETIKDKDMQSIVTDTFAGVKPGETKTSVIYASKIISNQDDSHVYGNHVEVIGLNSKTGRTIKGVKDSTREQVSKEYQPGNYVPNLSAVVHQQDDDNVRITITPPTGITNYTIIYIITSVIGLIVITGGIILIKKKFINK